MVLDCTQDRKNHTKTTLHDILQRILWFQHWIKSFRDPILSWYHLPTLDYRNAQKFSISIFLKLELITHVRRSINKFILDWFCLQQTVTIMYSFNLLVFSFQCFQYPNYFRIVLTVPAERTQLACKRINEFCKNHRKSDVHNTSSA